MQAYIWLNRGAYPMCIQICTGVLREPKVSHTYLVDGAEVTILEV